MMWVTIAIAIFGAIAAVQLGRWRAARRRERRLAEFRNLTMTKANTIASGYADALNSTPVELYGHNSVVYYGNVNPRPLRKAPV